MKNDIYLIGEVGYEITLDKVIAAVNDSDKSQVLNVHIHSPGGSVYDGLAIYNHLKSLAQEVHTHSSGLVASIASVIFLAGTERTINKTDSFLIHLPMNMGFGNAEDLEKNAKELRKIESQLADIYASETNLTTDEAMDLMKKDEFLDVDFLKEKSFVNTITEFKAVAKFLKPSNIMTKDDKSWIEEKFNSIAKMFKPEPINKVVQDANGVEIDFQGLEEDATPKVGDKARVDNADASGDYLMPSGETFVFEAGELTEIKVEESDEEMEALKAENEELKQQLSEVNASLETTTEATAKLENEFNELKSKVTSSFEWSGKEPEAKKETGAEEVKKRKLYKEKA